MDYLYLKQIDLLVHATVNLMSESPNRLCQVKENILFVLDFLGNYLYM